MRLLKDVAKRVIFSPLIPQPAWERLRHLSLRAMNIGGGSDIKESGERWLLEALSSETRRASVVLDVGANIGNYAEEVLKRFPKDTRLVCFEPSAGPFSALQARLASAGRGEAYQLGLHDQEARLLLHSDPSNSAMASMYERDLEHVGIELSQTEEITLTTLDSFCAAHAVEVIRLLKLDCEGNELKALEGAGRMLSEGRVEVIQFEFGGCNLDSRTYLRDFFQILTPRYRLFRLLRHGLAAMPVYNEKLEVFTTTNFVAILSSSDLFDKWR